LENQKVRNERDQVHSEVVLKSGPLGAYKEIAEQKLLKKRNLSMQLQKLTKNDVYSTA
jgi:hypothetical protein